MLLNAPKKKKVRHKEIIVITCFHTYKWIVNCVFSLMQHVPEVPILFIDNNPSTEDSIKRKASYERPDSYANASKWDKYCELERQFIRHVPNSHIFRTDVNLWHGEAINQAVLWCDHNSFTTMVHIEPDCFVWGRTWYDNLKQSIKYGNWMSGGTQVRGHQLHITPTAWDVEKCLNNKFNFMPAPKIIKGFSISGVTSGFAKEPKLSVT